MRKRRHHHKTFPLGYIYSLKLTIMSVRFAAKVKAHEIRPKSKGELLTQVRFQWRGKKCGPTNEFSLVSS